MRSLAQPKILARAGLAAIITALACYPRLALWSERPEALLYLWLTLLWSVFFLWAFVFAWQPSHAGRPVLLAADGPPALWAAATVCALAAALLLHFFVDPQLRVITPQDYPANGKSWLAMCLFTLAMDPLFLCFAPFALFIRLSRQRTAALFLTVMFGVGVLYLKLRSSKDLPPAGMIVELWALRIIAGFSSVYLYLRGGAVLVWWFVLLVQLRHLIDLWMAP